MAAESVITAFRLRSRVNEDFIRNVLRQHHQQRQQRKYQPTTTTAKYQPMHIRRCFEIYTGKDLR